MPVISDIDYRGYNITVSEDAGRFTPRVNRRGQMMEYEGRMSEIWAAASCGALDRALHRAMSAIDTGHIK